MLRNTNNQTNPLQACENQVTSADAQKLWKKSRPNLSRTSVNGSENSWNIHGSFKKKRLGFSNLITNAIDALIILGRSVLEDCC